MSVSKSKNPHCEAPQTLFIYTLNIFLIIYVSTRQLLCLVVFVYYVTAYRCSLYSKLKSLSTLNIFSLSLKVITV